MNDSVRRALRVGAVVIACVVTACSPSAGRREPPAKPVEPAAVDVNSYIAKGNYAAALDILSARYDKDRGNAEARDAFSRTLQEVRSKGDDAFARGQYEKAGVTYRLLLKHLSGDNGIARNLPFSSGYLSGRIEKCAKTLTDSGLARYGAGDLENAIRIWNSVLAFDPDNVDVKRAVETATVQLKTLKGAP